MTGQARERVNGSPRGGAPPRGDPAFRGVYAAHATSGERDLDDHYAVMRAVEAIRDRLPAVAARRRLTRHGLAYVYDFADAIDGLPGLAVACVFPPCRFAIEARPPGGPARNVILCPGFPIDGLNRTIIASQTGLHHEVAHLLLDHAAGPGYERRGVGHVNDPIEIDAFLHQSLAAASRIGAWEDRNVGTFRAAVLAATPRAFLDLLTPANRAAYVGRVEGVHAAVVARRANAVPQPMTSPVGSG